MFNLMSGHTVPDLRFTMRTVELKAHDSELSSVQKSVRVSPILTFAIIGSVYIFDFKVDIHCYGFPWTCIL